MGENSVDVATNARESSVYQTLISCSIGGAYPHFIGMVGWDEVMMMMMMMDAMGSPIVVVDYYDERFVRRTDGRSERSPLARKQQLYS
jgi:hypothetical protein